MTPILKCPICTFSPPKTSAHHPDSWPIFLAGLTPELSALALSCFITFLSHISPLHQIFVPTIPPKHFYLDNQRPCLTGLLSNLRPPTWCSVAHPAALPSDSQGSPSCVSCSPTLYSDLCTPRTHHSALTLLFLPYSIFSLDGEIGSEIANPGLHHFLPVSVTLSAVVMWLVSSCWFMPCYWLCSTQFKNHSTVLLESVPSHITSLLSVLRCFLHTHTHTHKNFERLQIQVDEYSTRRSDDIHVAFKGKEGLMIQLRIWGVLQINKQNQKNKTHTHHV